MWLCKHEMIRQGIIKYRQPACVTKLFKYSTWKNVITLGHMRSRADTPGYWWMQLLPRPRNLIFLTICSGSQGLASSPEARTCLCRAGQMHSHFLSKSQLNDPTAFWKAKEGTLSGLPSVRGGFEKCHGKTPGGTFRILVFQDFIVQKAIYLTASWVFSVATQRILPTNGIFWKQKHKWK